MKKVLSILLAIMMLIPLCTFGLSAKEAEALATEKCTTGMKNIASDASVTHTGAWWAAMNDSVITDGNTGNMSHSPKQGNFSWTLNFGSLKQVTNVTVYLNIGAEENLSCSYCGGHNASSVGVITSIQLIFFDDLGNQIDQTKSIDTAALTKVEFDIDTTSIAKIEVQISSETYGGAVVREVEVYEETGAHAWEYDEANSLLPSCEETGVASYKCSCGATKTEDLPAHTVEEWSVLQAPTITQTGMASGPCTVPGCGGTGYKVIPKVSYGDSSKTLNLSNLTITPDIKVGTGEKVPLTQQAKPENDYKVLFDGIIETATYGGKNIWCGTGWTETTQNVITPDDPNTADKDETVYETIPHYSTLTIEFDQEYTLIGTELYLFSNNNSFVVDLIGKDGTVVKSFEKAGYEYTSGFARMVFTGEVYGLNVKSVVITIKSAKWEYGTGLAFTEMKLNVHDCVFSEDDIATGTTENCVTKFNGTCIYCKTARTDAIAINHTFAEGDQGTVVKPVTCYSKGETTKRCTACNTDISFYYDETGVHDFENGVETVVEKNNCGVDGSAYRTCATEGCGVKTDPYVLKATGEHMCAWKEIPGQEADYTHTGTQQSICETCGFIDTAKGTQESKVKSLTCVKTDDYSIRYTDFVSPRATFKITLSSLKRIDKDYNVKIFGIVTKGEQSKEVQIYGEGATGLYNTSTGEFSLVVKDAKPTDEYVFSVRVEITSRADSTQAINDIKQKVLPTSPDGLISAAGVAYYYASNEGRLNKDVPAELHDMYKDLASRVETPAE